MALNDNIVSYWKLNESSGNAADSVASNTLTNNGTVTYNPGLLGNCANFGNDAVNRYLNRVSALGATIDSAKSISLWLKLNTEITTAEYWPMEWRFTGNGTTTSGHIVISYDYNSGTRRLYLLKEDGNGHSSRINYTVTLGTSVFHHIVITTDGSTWTLYVDGASVGTVADYVNSGGNGSYTNNFLLAAADRPDMFNLDEVGLWSRAITATEVGQIYNSGVGYTYPLPLFSSVSDMSVSSDSQLFGLIISFSETSVSSDSAKTGYGFTNQSKSSSSWTNVQKS